MRRNLLLFGLLLFPAFSQESIRYLADRKLWVLDAGPLSYAFGINERGAYLMRHA